MTLGVSVATVFGAVGLFVIILNFVERQDVVAMVTRPGSIELQRRHVRGLKAEGNSDGKEVSTTNHSSKEEGLGSNSAKSYNSSSSVVEGGNEEEPASLQAENHTQPLYDENGWHLEPEDFVSKVIHPEELPPFYILPVFFAVKLIFTMIIFGVSLRFKPEVDEGCVCRFIQFIGKRISEVGMILMAINGYWRDYERYTRHEVGADTTSKRVSIFLIVWLTSGNYIACRAIWNNLLIENPVRLLGLEAKRPLAAIPPLGVPLCPGGAKWLKPLKHLYALLLFPYFLPYYAVNMLLGCVMCCWLCSTKCALVISTLVASCNFCCALVGTVLTLGLVSWLRNACHYWWLLEEPIYYQTLMQFWATGIAPSLFGLLYGILLCASADNILGGLARGAGQSGAQGSPDDVLRQGILPDDDKKVLTAYNLKELEEDFKLDGYSSVESELGGVEASLDPKSLDDSKIIIFVTTLRNMSSIVLEQLTLIFLVRAMSGVADLDHYVGALQRTVTERTWKNYFSHMQAMTLMTTMDALNSDVLSNVVNALNYWL